MFRKKTLKILAVEFSMLILAFTLQDIRAQERQPEVAKRTNVSQTNRPAETEPAKPEVETTDSETLIYSRDWGADDAEILLKIAIAEAEGESTEGKALVMLVALNRVWSDGFPDSVQEVVFQDGQFSVTAEGGRYYTTEPDRDCYEALKLIESGWDESRGALYFESCKEDSWHSRNLEFLYEVGNHRFYR